MTAKHVHLSRGKNPELPAYISWHVTVNTTICFSPYYWNCPRIISGGDIESLKIKMTQMFTGYLNVTHAYPQTFL